MENNAKIKTRMKKTLRSVRRAPGELANGKTTIPLLLLLLLFQEQGKGVLRESFTTN
jgi:hypothetical protein